MNQENHIVRTTDTNHPSPEPAAFSGETDTSRPKSAFPAKGTPQGIRRPLFVLTGMALCMGIASCVYPYEGSQAGGSVTVSSYRPGYTVTSLPSGYQSEIISGSTYYYHDGHYYNRGSAGYVVVEAPRTSRYYSDYSRRQQGSQRGEYREPNNRHDQRFEHGEVLTTLPSGHRVVNRRGNTYYQVDDRYYRRDGNSYVIVTNPY